MPTASLTVLLLLPPEAGDFKAEYAEPNTDMQKMLCAAFEKVLGVENVGADDSFFALGGDSIKWRLVAEACETYGIRTADIFAGDTPRMIERVLLQKATKRRSQSGKQERKVYPLTPYERGMYIEQKMSPESTVYLLNLNIAAIIKGADTRAASIECR